MCTKIHVFMGKLGDYLDCPEEKENDTYMTITTNTPKSSKKVEDIKVGQKENTPNKQYLPQTIQVNKLITGEKFTPNNPMLMSRIQRDLNSPSASARVRALKALSSPAKSPYNNFDIPESEQSFNFSVQEAPDIKEVMRDIIVYVEVRSGEDNRSDGVRKVIEALGARVNLKLLRDTTHVVFKDGLMSTFKKARQWGIPIVSILWIEACKTKNRICDPKDYPISNLDRYENPELYTKMKRFRYMQPDSEDKINRKAGNGSAQRDLTPTQKTGAIKKNSTLISGTPTSSSITKKKTDISQYFKKLDNSRMTTPIISVAKGSDIESPATQLLNRISSNNYTPLMQTKKTSSTNTKTNNIELYDEESRESVGNIQVKDKTNKVKKALDFVQMNDVQNGEKNSVLDTPSSRTRRRNSLATTPAAIVPAVNDDDGTKQILDTPTKSTRRRTLLPAVEFGTKSSTVSNTPSKVSSRRSGITADATELTNTVSTMTPSRNTRRRSSLHTPKNMTIETPRKQGKQIQPIMEEDAISEETVKTFDAIQSSSRNAGKTLDSARSMEISNEDMDNDAKEKEPTTQLKSTRRRTIFSYTNNDTSNVTTRRATCYSVKSIEATNTIKDNDICAKSADLSNKILNTMNNGSHPCEITTKKLPATNRRRTLYTPKKSDQNNDPQTFTAGSLQPQLSDGLCVTPTAGNMHGKVVSSTFLESEEKIIQTPPATATSGKLLEETEQCVTPLVFSSTRLPGNKRRTMFDVSMDIITQRLQCINQSARRSLAPTTTLDAVHRDANSILATNKVDTRKTIMPISDTDSTESLDSTHTNLANDKADNTDKTSESTPTLKKKRKLFVPNELLTPPSLATITSKCGASDQKSVTKRRRTLLPLSQQALLSTTMGSATDLSTLEPPPSQVPKRRSTLDFEQIKQIQNKVARKETLKGEQKSVDANKAICDGAKKTPVLVYTNMHKEQIDVIREVVNKLALFSLEQTVTENTTHLVTLEARRTMNLLRAIARGLWIVDYNWILDSQKAGKWLEEEPYEFKDFSRAIEICRSERQAFGDNYKCELFQDLGPFYISARCYPVTKNDMCELIKLCGGRLVHSRNNARYIIGDTTQTVPDKIYVTPYWILDSISQMQIMKIQKYLCQRSDEPPPPGSPAAAAPKGITQNVS
ncbi:microcephalin isoform X2 [Haematobia irritans]|uniref:microcephalin isoform X2 n=1 Tax=Haematobia irritans TaxID=7368 RepID=UPI003F4FE52F